MLAIPFFSFILVEFSTSLVSITSSVAFRLPLRLIFSVAFTLSFCKSRSEFFSSARFLVSIWASPFRFASIVVCSETIAVMPLEGSKLLPLLRSIICASIIIRGVLPCSVVGRLPVSLILTFELFSAISFLACKITRGSSP